MGLSTVMEPGYLRKTDVDGSETNSTNTDTAVAAAVAATANVPITGTTTGDIVKFSNTTGALADSGVPITNLPASGTTAGNLAKFSNTTGALADSGVAVTNFQASSTVAGDLVAFSGTTGQQADAGASKGTVGALNIAGVAGGATAPLALPSQSAAPTGTHQIGEMYVNTAGVWFSCVSGGASPIWSPEFMPNVTGGISQLLPGGYSFLVCNSFETTLGDTVEIGSGAFLEIT